MKQNILLVLILATLNTIAQNKRIYEKHLQGEFKDIIACNKYLIKDSEGKIIEVLMEQTVCDENNPNHKNSIDYLKKNVLNENVDVLVYLPLSNDTKVQGKVLYGCWIDPNEKVWTLNCPNGSDNLFEELYRIGCLKYNGEDKQIKRFIKKTDKNIKKKKSK